MVGHVVRYGWVKIPDVSDSANNSSVIPNTYTNVNLCEAIQDIFMQAAWAV